MHIIEVLLPILLISQATYTSTTDFSRNRRTPNIKNIRLSGNGGTRFRGRVEIQGSNDTWGTICDDSFDVNDATVVCRMLGFNSGYASAYQGAHYGEGSGPIWLDDLGCNGNERDLDQCTSNGWGHHNCGHGEDASVACDFVVQNIRLAGSGSTNSRGRVEVSSPNGTWGWICDQNFDQSDAKVVCRMLGFNDGPANVYRQSYFGIGSGPVWFGSLDCRGNETNLDQCPSSESTCNGYEAGVACGNDAVIRTVRLVGRRGAHEGRVEILGPDGKWGTMNGIHPNAAKVICRMLGFDKGGVTIFYQAFFEFGSGPTYYCANYECKGSETFISECCTSGFVINYSNDINRDETGISCHKENDIRLAGGNSELEGRVEVYHNGVWGTVCNDNFDSKDAEVICYMLGYETRSLQLYTYNRYGTGTGQIWLNNLSCNGTESRLDECPSLTWGANICSHSQDVGVDCRQSVRLYGGRYPSEGYVQIGNDWKNLCALRFSYLEAQVVCRQLDFNTTYWNPTSYELPSVSSSKTELSCPLGTESNLGECKQGICPFFFDYSPYVNCTGSLNARLVGGAHIWEGTLMIQSNLDSKLYRVCTDVWTDKEATLFCQLISLAVKGEVYGKIIRNTAFDKQPGSFVFLSTHCIGGLPLCAFEVNSTESCPFTDIAVSCSHFERDSQHRVRLVGGQAEYEGRVEIKFNNTWHTLCDNWWDFSDANVICRTLGYWVSSYTPFTNAWFGQGSIPSSDVYPNCHGNEPSIFDCPIVYNWGATSCSHSDDAGIRCSPETLGRNKIRLAYGPGPWKGKLEVFYNDHWGGVCMTSWTQRNTDVVCRMLMYHSERPTHYIFNGTSTTILIGDLQCRGNETDIGLCKAYLDKANCTDEVVAIDCSDGIQARLTGGNLSMGYAQLQENGSWRQICSSGWSSEEATVICRTLGFSVAVASTNVGLSNGVSAREYLSIDCGGWEDHIRQCRLQNPSSNCGPAAVNCLNCYYEYTYNTGTVASPNYPSYYPRDWSCIYIIRPHGPSRTGLYTLKFNQMALYSQGDEVQVRDGFRSSNILGSWKGFLSISGNLPPVVAKEFSIHFKSDSSYEYPGFQAEWKPSILEDALTAGCSSSGWDITINTKILQMLYPDVNPGDIYMTSRSCIGKVVDDGLQFLYSYGICNTQTQTTSNEVIYTNQLIQPVIDPKFPSVVFNHQWRVQTRCSMPVTDISSVNIYPTEGEGGSFIDNSYHNLSSTTHGSLLFHFYTDPAFHDEIKGTLYVPFGHELYVKVLYDSQGSNMKMRVDTCTVYDQSSPSQKFNLIHDGCPSNSKIHLISVENKEMRFSYQVFEFQDSSHRLTLNCNATFCVSTDSDRRCTPGCTTKRALVPQQESDPKVTNEFKSQTMILQMDVPDAVLFAGTTDRHFAYNIHDLSHSNGPNP